MLASVGRSTDITCDFLKLCLQCRWDPQVYIKAQQLLEHSTFDWNAFCDQVESDNLAPLVSFLLADQDWIPESTLGRLHKQYIATAIQNTLLFRELASILSSLGNSDVKVVLLKGAALASQIYPSIALRPMVDLDLLVLPADTTQAIDSLRQLGYQEIRQEEQSGFTLQYENEVALRKNAVIPILVEIHWNLFNSPYYQNKLSQEWLWNNTQTIPINDFSARLLQPEIQFLHLCGHLSYHHSGQEVWLWYHDLAEMIMFYGERLNWDELFDFAGKYDLLLSLKANLRILLGIYGPIIPRAVIATLEHTTPSAREQKYYPRLSSQKKSAGQIFWDDFNSLPGWRNKFHFAFSNLFPSPKYMQNRYQIKHSIYLPIYYPYRWIRGILSLF